MNFMSHSMSWLMSFLELNNIQIMSRWPTRFANDFQLDNFTGWQTFAIADKTINLWLKLSMKASLRGV